MIQVLAGILISLLAASVALAQGGQAPARPQAAESDPALRAYFAGNGLLNRGMFEAAITEYRSFLSTNPAHDKAAVARYGMVVSLFRLDRCDEALAELKDLKTAKDFAYGAEVGMIEGQCLLAKENYAKAAEVFGSVMDRFRAGELADDAAASQCEALYRAGEFDNAAKQCQTVASSWPESPLLARSEFFRAFAEMARKDYTAAAKCLTGYEKKFPKGEFAQQVPLLLAQCYQRGNDAERAIERYAAVVKAGDPQQVPDALLGLGTLLFQAGKYAEAEKALDTLASKFPDSPAAKAALLQRAHVWFAEGEFDKSFAAFEQAGKADKSLAADVAYWMAKCELRKGANAEAARRLALAMEQFGDSPLRPEMEYDRAVALVRAGKLDEAGAALDQFLARNADHRLAVDALQLSAACANQRGEYERSAKLCADYVKRFPKGESLATMAYLAAENDFLADQFAPAAKKYNEFLSHFPSDARADEARLRLATAYYRLEKFDDAAAAFEQVAGKARDNPLFRPALLALGDIAFQRGEWKTAESRLGEYLADDGASDGADDALMKLAYARQKQGRSDEAARDYEQLVAKFPKSTHRAQALFERGQILADAKKTHEAEESFKAALAEEPDQRLAAPILNQLAFLASQRGAQEEAARYYEQAAGKAGDGDEGSAALLRQGQALMAANKFAEAEAVFRKVKNAEGSARAAIAISRQDRAADALKEIAKLESAGDVARLPAPLREGVRYEKAWALRSLKKNAEAAETYREMVADRESGSLRLTAMLELAELEAGEKQFESAAKTLQGLQDLLSSQPEQKELAEQCLYRLAVCKFELEQFAPAAELFERFNRDFSQSKLLASSLFYAGEANFRTGKVDRASKLLTTVVDEYSTEEFAAPSMLRLGECHATLQKWALSEEVFQRYLERFPDAEQWYQAQFGIGWSRENQKRYDEAIGAYEKVTARHQGPTAARAQFQIGQCLFAQKKFEPATRELLKVDILYSYPEWSAAALYEAGRCFSQMNDPVKARDQFNTVVRKFKETKWAEMAGKQLAELTSAASLPGK